jgi:hypothetical protein
LIDVGGMKLVQFETVEVGICPALNPEMAKVGEKLQVAI